jgi:hypothetical protein
MMRPDWVWAQGAICEYLSMMFTMFSVRDTGDPSGTLGVFARSAGDTPLTVSFSNLKVYSAVPVRRQYPLLIFTLETLNGQSSP